MSTGYATSYDCHYNFMKGIQVKQWSNNSYYIYIYTHFSLPYLYIYWVANVLRVCLGCACKWVSRENCCGKIQWPSMSGHRIFLNRFGTPAWPIDPKLGQMHDQWVSHMSGSHVEVDAGKYDGQTFRAIVFSHVTLRTNNATNKPSANWGSWSYTTWISQLNFTNTYVCTPIHVLIWYYFISGKFSQVKKPHLSLFKKPRPTFLTKKK